MIDNLKVVLFDLDGTIIDTEPYHYLCWNSILQDYGAEMNYDYYLANYSGVSIDENCRKLAERYQMDVSLNVLKTQKEQLMIDLLQNQDLAPMAYVHEMIDFLHENDIDLGLVTSSSKEETDIILKGLALEKTFIHQITRDDVLHKKPHPEPYLLAKERFKLPVDNFVVFEDSLSGILSAKAAGMCCYAVHNGYMSVSLHDLRADGTFKNLFELKNTLFSS